MKTDISGSTSHFRQLLAADLEALLREHRDFVARHAVEHDGRIDAVNNIYGPFPTTLRVPGPT